MIRTAMVTVAIALTSGAALAAEEAAHGAAADGHEAAVGNPVAFDLIPFVSALVLFGVVLWLLNWKVWPVITKALAEREGKIRTEIDTAERSRKQAEAALQQYEKALAEARNEAAKIVEQTRSEQQKVAAELRSKTEAELQGMREGARRDIEAAKRAAVSEIYSHMAGVSTSIASKILQREIKPEDQERLVEESLGQLQSAGSN